MQWGSFTKLCMLWHLDRFWHIHIPIRDSDYGDLGSVKKTVTSVPNDLMANVEKSVDQCMLYVSLRTDLPIRWSTNSGKVVWTHRGAFSSPYEPAMYSTTMNGKPYISSNWAGYVPNSGLVTANLVPTTGQYSTKWQTDGDADRPTEIGCKDSVGMQWSEVLIKHREYPAIKEWGTAFNPADVVFYHGFKTTKWFDANGCPLPRLYGPEGARRRCSMIRESHVWERGHIAPDGTPNLARIVALQEHLWYAVGGPSILGGHEMDRVDGPSKVTLESVMTRIVGDRTVAHLSATRPHHHIWAMNGQMLPPSRMTEIIKKHGIIMREGPLHDQSAFPRNDDLLIWATTKW